MSQDTPSLWTQVANYLESLPYILDSDARSTFFMEMEVASVWPMVEYKKSDNVIKFVQFEGGMIDVLVGLGQAEFVQFLERLKTPTPNNNPSVSDVEELDQLVMKVLTVSAEEWDEQFVNVRMRAAQTLSTSPAADLTALRAARQSRQQAASSLPLVLNADVLRGVAVYHYDLIPQEVAFLGQFSSRNRPQAPRSGIFFSCYQSANEAQVPDQAVEPYVVARMEECLRDRLFRNLLQENTRRVILDMHDIAGAGLALNAVNAKLLLNGKNLEELLAKKGPDTFLSIVNPSKSTPQSRAFMQTLAQQIRDRHAVTVEQNGLYLLVFWIDWVPPSSLRQLPFLGVPVLSDFNDIDDVVQWFQNQLSRNQVPESLCDSAGLNLRNRLGGSGIPSNVYRAMETVLTDLSQGRIA